eukprot:TRINITY_DN67969_c9_g2_i1.p1 TRINITY_DN67969_c9_g2~~TRINITY_DN67969_c9_g2_i1.p1  ORF type:complete len:394 (+),score=37.38 TRINITY_DN67969_c9_g2_i1:19-1200(+)
MMLLVVLVLCLSRVVAAEAEREQNQKWILSKYVPDWTKLAEHNLQLVDCPYPTVGEGEVLLQLQYISLDATLPRMVMNEALPPWWGRELLQASTPNLWATLKLKEGDTMFCTGISLVLESSNKYFPPGSMVYGYHLVQKYWSYNPKKPLSPFVPLQVLPSIKELGLQPRHWLGPLSMNAGVTAYLAITNLAPPQKDHVVYISAAAGGVGYYAGQIFKLLGAKRVIGSTSNLDDKKATLFEAGYDFLIDYKKDNLTEKLKQYAPNGLHTVFDNVGGKTLQIAISHLKEHANVLLCGAVSEYDKENTFGITNLMELIVRQTKVHGFSWTRWSDQAGPAVRQLMKWIGVQKLQTSQTMEVGFETYAEAFLDLYKGVNVGKLVLAVRPLEELKRHFH